MIIDCISDLHGYKPDLPGGDLLIIAGDMTARDTPEQWDAFYKWLANQNYRKRIIIGGNHDNMLMHAATSELMRAFPPGDFGPDSSYEYLFDNGCEFEGLKIWGTPWTKRFPGQNPVACAFTVGMEYQLDDIFKLIPADTDILISHGPPLGILDSCPEGRVGSLSLYEAFLRINPKLMVFGHIHECGGKMLKSSKTICVNASYVNAQYKPVHKPVRVIL